MEIVDDPTGNVPAQYYHMITGDDEALAKEAAKRISAYEIKMIQARMDPAQAEQIGEQPFAFTFAKISTYYMMNHCFFIEGQLLRDAHKLNGIPVYLCNGRVDPVTPPKAAYELSKLLDTAMFEVAQANSHNDADVFRLSRKGTDWVYSQIVK